MTALTKDARGVLGWTDRTGWHDAWVISGPDGIRVRETNGLWRWKSKDGYSLGLGSHDRPPSHSTTPYQTKAPTTYETKTTSTVTGVASRLEAEPLEVPAYDVGPAMRDGVARALGWAEVMLKVRPRVRYYKDTGANAANGFAESASEIWLNAAKLGGLADPCYVALHEAAHASQLRDGAVMPTWTTLAEWKKHPQEQAAQAFARAAMRRLDLGSRFMIGD